MSFALHYFEEGEGFPLILLHGNGNSGAYFKYQIPYFSPHYRVIALDTRGHGDSPRGDAPFTLAQFAQDLKDFLDAKGITRCHLLGFSDGANIVMLFAMRYPEYVERMVLNGGNMSPWGVKLGQQIPIVLRWLALCAGSVVNKSLVPRREMLGLMTTQPNITGAQLAALEIPTLVVAGENDMMRTGHTRAIAGAIAGSELHILPGDHFVARRRHEVFNPLAAQFLAGAGKAAP